MAQVTVYAQGAINWNGGNWYDAPAAGSIVTTNPQNGGGTTYKCVLNNQVVAINVAVDVDEITDAVVGGSTAGGNLTCVDNFSVACVTLNRTKSSATNFLTLNTAGKTVTFTVTGTTTHRSFGSWANLFRAQNGTINFTCPDVVIGTGSTGLLANAGTINFIGSIYSDGQEGGWGYSLFAQYGTINWKNQSAAVAAGTLLAWARVGGTLNLDGLILSNSGEVVVSRDLGGTVTLGTSLVKNLTADARASGLFLATPLQVQQYGGGPARHHAIQMGV